MTFFLVGELAAIGHQETPQNTYRTLIYAQQFLIRVHCFVQIQVQCCTHQKIAEDYP
ncbi:hypothetical protein AGR8A_Cc70108 [Agrobacterium fabrum str. J-07]|nr:hypothetical protein AGR8A_Cc70108 [Agrobacterium fabrum str. J-07]